MNRLLFSFCGAAFLLVANGCSCQSGTGEDGGSPADGGGGGPDSGGGMDAGGGSDSGMGTDAGGPQDAGPQMFPATSIIYQDVSDAGLDPNSATIISTLSGAGGWGGNGTFQIDFSLTVLHADPSVPRRTWQMDPQGYFSPDCDVTPFPVPPVGNIEGVADYNCDNQNNDCHLLVYQGQRLYEMYRATIDGGTSTGVPFYSVCEVAWDLTRDYWQSGTPYSRGDYCTSADAAGLPMAPLIVTGAELQAGVVNHPLRLILPNPRIAAGTYVHPATHIGAPGGGPNFPKYGARLRLRANYPTTGLSPAAISVVRALQKYGMFVADGGNIPLTMDSTAAAYLGSHDLGAIQVTDFDVIASPDPPVVVTGTSACTRTPLSN